MIKKIIIILQILMLIMPTMSVLANNINIGDEIQVERGPLGFYTIQYWDVTRDEWMYVIYSQTYYTDKDGSKKIAYCVNPDLSGVGWVNGEDESYSTKVEYKLTDERIQRVLENGYPYVSYTRLGVETEEDGYLATKQAIYWIIRNRKLENIYDYFRPGQTQINGQNLEDTQRRGTKVIDAIYKLVDIGYNGTTKDKNVDKPEFTELSEFKQDRYNYQFYSKEYRVEKAKSEIKIIGTSLEGMKVVDMNGRTKTTLKAGDRFKVMVPQAKIDTDMEINIKYESVETTYPVYYTTSNVEGRQNYIIVQNKEELVQRNLKFDVKGNLSTLEIIKVDKETGELIPGTTFEVAYKDGETIGRYTTDEEGHIVIKNLYQGIITMQEVEANEDYALDNRIREIRVNYNAKTVITINNERKIGSMEITKVDKDDKTKTLEGVEFDLINDKGEVVSHLVTNQYGKARVLNIKAGNYILRETKTNEKYKIGVDQNVTINHNETLEIEIENEKKKGQIQISKTSEDKNEILQKEAGEPIEGIKYNIYDLEGNLLEQLITNEAGVATSKKYPLGEYIVQEADAGEWYHLNDEKRNVKISEDGEIVMLDFKNKAKQPRVNITKSCKNSIKSNEEIKYEFEIMNSGEVSLENFTWYDILPSEQAKITKISTGTYNQELSYNICYKTNYKDTYMIAKANLNTTQNNYIDLTQIHLEEGEKITEIKINFGTVKVGFCNIEKPHIYMQVNSDLENDTKIKNHTILDGFAKDYKVSDEDTATSTIYNVIEKKKLPRTGF